MEFVKPQRVNKAMTGPLQKGQCGSDEGAARSSHRQNRTTKPKSAIAFWSTRSKPASLSTSPASARAKAFAGGVKRWHYAGGDAYARFDVSSRAGRHRRQFVSVARLEEPAFPGSHGQPASNRQNLKVVKVDTDENLLLVRGSVPGLRRQYIFNSQRQEGSNAALQSSQRRDSETNRRHVKHDKETKLCRSSMF